MSIIEAVSTSLRPDFFNYKSLYAVHYHEIIYSFVFYNVLFLACPGIGKYFFGMSYVKLDKKNKLNFDIHIIAMIQCLISIVACLYLFGDNSLSETRHSQLLGYNYDYSFISAITVGYFIWDLLVCILYYDLFGFAFLFHAIASLFVFSITFIPFFQYWVPRFLIFELSSPFVNINWFITKLPAGAVSTKFNIINGLLLLTSFFSVRVVWGFYAIYQVIDSLVELWPILGVTLRIISSIVVGINFSLDVLNLFWFSKMLKIAKKMATRAKKSSEKKYN